MIEVDVPDLVMTLIFEELVIKCGSKRENQRDLCSKEIDYMLKIMLTILG